MPESISNETTSRSAAVAGFDAATIRAYEDAATAIGRLDAAACLSEPGFRDLLVLRCVATACGASHEQMIALARQDREGEELRSQETVFFAALRAGAARSRGGALPSVASLHELLGLTRPVAPAGAVDDLLRDVHERTPAVLKAALSAQALQALRTLHADPLDSAAAGAPDLAALAVPLILCVGGATTDAWITLSRRHAPGAGHDGTVRSLRDTFGALAREARSAERGLHAAREVCDADETRVRDALGRAAYSALDVLALLRHKIVITVPETARTLGLTPPTAGAAVARLVELGIAREVTGKARLRAFACDGMVKALAP